MVIELDDGGGEDNDKDAYAPFEAVEAGNGVSEEAAEEAERFGVNLVSSIKPYFITSTPTCRQDLLFIVYI